MSALVATPAAFEEIVNERFASIENGFINSHNEPAMTTPTVIAVQTVVVGSTICLIC